MCPRKPLQNLRLSLSSATIYRCLFCTFMLLILSKAYLLSRSSIFTLLIPFTPPNADSPSLFPVRLSGVCLPNSKRFSRVFSKKSPMSPSSSSSSAKVVAEYAKSSRSSCKKCSKMISAKDLRLGSVSRDARGFDMTRWFHLDCFSFGSESEGSAEAIKGFAALKSSDQEALVKLFGASVQSKMNDSDISQYESEESKESSKEKKIHPRDEDKDVELQERDIKKVELSTHKLDIVLSASDIKSKYKDATLLPKWKAFETLIFLEREDGLHDSSKIAAFDFDGCLAKTSVKRVGSEAWSLMFPSIPGKLQTLYNEGFKLVIFTNESNIERWKNKRQVAVDSKIGRLNNFINLVKVPIQVFIACGWGKSDGGVEDPYRKPNSGMWQIMVQHFNSGIPIDMDKSFYVGDAAGRINDHSDADINFAKVIGLKFYVPEEYFTT